MSNLLTHIGAGLIGAGLTVIGAGIYIKKYYEDSKADNIEQWKQPPPLKAKKPIILPNLKTTSPLFTSIGKPENATSSLPAALDLPVLHDFEKLQEPVQDVLNLSETVYQNEDNSALSAPINFEDDAEVPYDNTILLMADMKLKNN